MSNEEKIDEKIAYKPGTFRYHDLPIDKRKQYFQARQEELNPCLHVSKIFLFVK